MADDDKDGLGCLILFILGVCLFANCDDTGNLERQVDKLEKKVERLENEISSESNANSGDVPSERTDEWIKQP